MPARLRLEISCGAGGGSRTPPALCGPPRVSKRHSPARLPGTSRATRWEDLHRANGDTFGDTFRVAKQVRRCQNLGEIQANTVVTGLLSRTISSNAGILPRMVMLLSSCGEVKRSACAEEALMLWKR